MDSFIDSFKNGFWGTITDQFAPVKEVLPDNMILILGIIALTAFLAFSSTQRYTGYVTTVYHEAGHALAALTTGGLVKGIKIRKDQSGETGTLTSRFLPFNIWVSWWGYPVPAVIGAVYIWASTTGYQKTALFLTLIMMIILFINIRSLYAFIWITLSMIGAWGAWWLLPNTVMSIVLFALGSFLIFGGYNSLINLTNIHLRGRREEIEHSDAYHMQKMTYIIPAFFWLATFWIASIAATWFAVSKLF